MDTKACNLTKNEIKNLIIVNGQMLGYPDANFNDVIERLNYLHKRLKVFEDKDEMPASAPQPNAIWPNN